MSPHQTARLELVTANAVVPLRRSVLRPDLPPELANYAYDHQPETFHVAALSDDGEVIGCATFFPSPLEGTPAWALRGMATAAEQRSRGIGGAVLEFGVAEISRRGGTVVWCKGRVRAGDFYRRHGFEARGEQFHVEPSGPHYVFVRSLA